MASRFLMKNTMQTATQAMFDFIIIGAGSAGCVLANRLSADRNKRVLLIEAGGDSDNFLIQMPKGMGKLVTDPRHAWLYAVQQPREAGTMANETWVRGRGLGGSSSINGMIYVRGQPQDYEQWERVAGAEWGWPAMKQAFRSIEDHELGDDGLRGVGGPVHISAGTFRYPLAERLIEAGTQMGLQRREDLNREDQEGIGYYCHNIAKGRRQSAATAFLTPIRHRKNLSIVTGAHVDRAIFDGTRASGIDCRIGGERVEYRSVGEIILCAGTMHSPKILQLSGIGPAQLLRSLGIGVVVDSPDVGSRLRDHLGFTLSCRLRGDRGINHRFYGFGLWRSVLQYLAFRSGPMATGPFEVGAFVRVDPAAERPDVQLYLGGLTLARSPDENVPAPMKDVDRFPGMSIYGQLLQLTSEGSVRISSAESAAALTITPNWLATSYDQTIAVAMVRYVRQLLQSPAIKPFVGDELMPGEACNTDDAILRMFRRHATCGTHAVATCRMGRDERSVVDERLRVRGVTGMRVVDCSVMPNLISGNTNGPAMALGWRAADLILQDARAKVANSVQ